MNKSELVSFVADRTGLSNSVAGEALDAVLDGIRSALRSGGDVRLAGFGNFSISHRKARQGRNPKTGETIQIAASKGVKFKAGKQLKEEVN